MGAQRTEIEQEIRHVVGNRQDIDTMLTTWTERAYQHLTSSIEFPEGRSTVIQTMTLGQSNYALPSDYFSTYNARNNDLQRKLIWVPPDEFDTYSTDREGPVERYSIFLNTFYVYPKPTSAEEIQHRYRKVFPALSTPTSTSELKTAWDPVLVALGAALALEFFNEDRRAASQRNVAARLAAELQKQLSQELYDLDAASQVLGGKVD